MNLVESLLTAMVRADGDALVMHVGERPYVVVSSGTLDLSTQILNLDAMTGMLQQLLPSTVQDSLEEFGAVEHRLQSHNTDNFTMVAARGGDDIWIEIRRRRAAPAAAEAVAAPLPAAAVEPTPPPVVELAPAIADVGNVEIAEIPEMAEIPEIPEMAEIPEMVAAVDETPVSAATVFEATPGEEPLGGQPAIEEQHAEEPQPVTEEEPQPVAEEMVAMVEEPIVVAEEPQPTVEEPRPEVAPALVVEAQAPVVEAPALIVEEPPMVVSALPEAVEAGTELLEERRLPQQPPFAPEPLAEAPIETPVALEAAEAFEVPDAVELTDARTEIPEVHEVPRAFVPAEVMAAPAAPAAPSTPSVRAADEALDAPDAPGLAAVLQMTHSVRIEVPPRSTTVRTSGIERLLRLAAARTASALFVTCDSRPSIRVEGDIRPLDGEAAMTRAEVDAAVMEIVPQAEQEAVGRGESTEWITEFADLGRVRCITFTDHRGPGVVIHMIATRAATAEQLGLSREVQALATEPQGLVLVAGAPGTGKSTLVSALVDLVNRQRAEYVVTLERQIRLVHDNRTAIVSQREIRGGADEALSAARAALREDPDVLVVDDLASAQMVPLLLHAATEGLVFVSITAPSTTEAVERFVDLAPAGERAGVEAALAETFRGAVSQVLLKKAGGGRVAAREVLLATAAVTRVISDGVPGQLQVALEGGRKHGMVPLADAIVALVQAGVVDVREAFRKSPDRDRLLSGLKREGIDTSVVERLA